MAQKPSIPKGTRDFSFGGDDAKKLCFKPYNLLFSVLVYSYRNPAMENLDTLMGKYGEEGDRLIFKILNSGDYLIESQYRVIRILYP